MTKLINWPTFLRDTGESDTFVYAVLASEGLAQFTMMNDGCLTEEDPEAGAVKDEKGTVWPMERQWFPFKGGRSTGLRLCLCMGWNPASWWDRKADRMWVCTKTELTPEGRQLIESLEALLEEEVTLLTFTRNGNAKR